MMYNSPDEGNRIPHYAELAWKLQTEKPAEPSKKLNVRKIVLAAIELADLEGLAGLSIRKLGKQLGFTTMAVYRYIESREELLILMLDTALGPPPDTIRAASTWQETLSRWGQELFKRYLLHPWLLDVPIVGPPTTPNHLQWVEDLLAGMESTGLPLQQRLDVSLLLDGHLRNMAKIVAKSKTGIPEAEQSAAAAWFPAFIQTKTFPYMAKALSDGALSDEDPFTIQFGLDCIIWGIESRINMRERTD